MNAGEIVVRKGYITRLDPIYGRSSTEIESLLGFRMGFLNDGWSLLGLMERPAINEFEMRGAAWLSDGVPGGHKLGKEVDRSALQPERSLLKDGWKESDVANFKQKQAAQFQLTGRTRLVKVVPKRSSSDDPADYPPGQVLSQWALLVPKRFIVIGEVGQNELPIGQFTALQKRWQQLVGQ
jgi:hypothetical protein